MPAAAMRGSPHRAGLGSHYSRAVKGRRLQRSASGAGEHSWLSRRSGTQRQVLAMARSSRSTSSLTAGSRSGSGGGARVMLSPVIRKPVVRVKHPKSSSEMSPQPQPGPGSVQLGPTAHLASPPQIRGGRREVAGARVKKKGRGKLQPLARARKKYSSPARSRRGVVRLGGTTLSMVTGGYVLPEPMPIAAELGTRLGTAAALHAAQVPQAVGPYQQHRQGASIANKQQHLLGGGQQGGQQEGGGGITDTQDQTQHSAVDVKPLHSKRVRVVTQLGEAAEVWLTADLNLSLDLVAQASLQRRLRHVAVGPLLEALSAACRAGGGAGEGSQGNSEDGSSEVVKWCSLTPTERVRVSVAVKGGCQYVPGVFFGGTPDPAAFVELWLPRPVLGMMSTAMTRETRAAVASVLHSSCGVAPDRFYVRFMAAQVQPGCCQPPAAGEQVNTVTSSSPTPQHGQATASPAKRSSPDRPGSKRGRGRVPGVAAVADEGDRPPTPKLAGFAVASDGSPGKLRSQGRLAATASDVAGGAESGGAEGLDLKSFTAAVHTRAGEGMHQPHAVWGSAANEAERRRVSGSSAGSSTVPSVRGWEAAAGHPTSSASHRVSHNLVGIPEVQQR